MSLSRRELLVVAATVAAGCDRDGDKSEPPAAQPASSPAPAAPPPAPEQVVDAGPVSGFAEDQVYDPFREQGFFVIRRGGQVFALSSICTHKGCKVRAQPDQSFFCRCHKSAFDRGGRVVSGPAPRPLPRLAVKTGDDGRLLVNLSRPIERETG